MKNDKWLLIFFVLTVVGMALSITFITKYYQFKHYYATQPYSIERMRHVIDSCQRRQIQYQDTLKRNIKNRQHLKDSLTRILKKYDDSIYRYHCNLIKPDLSSFYWKVMGSSNGDNTEYHAVLKLKYNADVIEMEDQMMKIFKLKSFFVGSAFPTTEFCYLRYIKKYPHKRIQ